MIAGIGTDLCDVRRIEAAVTRQGERFVARILGPQEQAVFHGRQTSHASRAWRYLASRFAAKEAFSKAIGLGMRSPMNWHDCQVLNNELGQPIIVLSGELAGWFARQAWHAHLSLSDEGDFALAFVVIDHRPTTA
ncbi:MAG TPA: holo-ACP synthase [Aquabacterium sp.]|nr:holo-ACP synthase [Aquabacterium sp.]